MKYLFDEVSAQCSKITTRKYSTSFSMGIYFLHKKFHQPVYGIYGFVRFADEIADSFHDHDQKFLLQKFRNDCMEAVETGISLNPILNSFQKVVNDYHIDLKWIHLFLDSMEMDLNPTTYTSEHYQPYILGSAEIVGLMCLKIFTERNEQQFDALKIPAMKLGSAFQKINFLRDLKSDSMNLNRNYFSIKNISAFSTTEKEKIEKEIESEMLEGFKGICQLPATSKSGVYLAYIYYKQLFKKIRKLQPEQIFEKRVRISNSRKISLLCDSMIRHKLNIL